MSIRVMSRIWQHSRQKGSNLLLLLAIADFANDDGIAFPSVRTLATKARLCERAVQYALGQLMKSGELRIERGAGPHGSHRFTIPQDVVGANVAPDANDAGANDAPGANRRMGGVQNSAKGGAPGCTQTIIEPSLNRQGSATPNRERERERERGTDHHMWLHTFAVARCEICFPPHEWTLPEPVIESSMPVLACPDWRGNLK